MLRDFRQLQELELGVTWSAPHQTLLSSVTSMEFQKVILSAQYYRNWGVFGRRRGDWVLIDGQLCGLVDRLHAVGCRRTLQVELQIEAIDDPGECDFTVFLPRFKEKGVVSVRRL